MDRRAITYVDCLKFEPWVLCTCETCGKRRYQRAWLVGRWCGVCFQISFARYYRLCILSFLQAENMAFWILILCFGLFCEGLGSTFDISPRQNMWITWANQTGQKAFCLSMATPPDPFRTCLISFPYLRLKDFKGYVSNSSLLNETLVDFSNANNTCHTLYNSTDAENLLCKAINTEIFEGILDRRTKTKRGNGGKLFGKQWTR